MLHRVALLAASLTAALVIAGGLALAGFGVPAPAGDMTAVDQATAPFDAAVPAAQEPQVQVDTIYVTPRATPAEITVTRVKEASRQSGEREDEDGDGDEGGDD